MRVSQEIRRLTYAAQMGNLEAVEFLLNQNPDLAKDWRPIMEAASFGHAKVVEALIARGADVNATSTGERNRPLHRAIEHHPTIPKGPGHRAIIELLLAQGADIESRGTWLSYKPLALAAVGGNREYVEILLAHGAQADIFSAAVIADVNRVASFLQKDSRLAQAKDTNSLTALHYCAASGLGQKDLVVAQRLKEIAALLVGRGADVTVGFGSCSHRVTPLKLAVHNNVVAEVLLNHGADPNDCLEPAIMRGNLALADLLLARGSNINALAVPGMTYLHWAVHWGNAGAAEWLLKKGANPNTKDDKKGWTPLHAAASRGSARMVQRFLDHKAKINSRDKEGSTPLKVALVKKRASQGRRTSQAARSARVNAWDSGCFD